MTEYRRGMNHEISGFYDIPGMPGIMEAFSLLYMQYNYVPQRLVIMPVSLIESPCATRLRYAASDWVRLRLVHRSV